MKKDYNKEVLSIQKDLGLTSSIISEAMGFSSAQTFANKKSEKNSDNFNSKNFSDLLDFLKERFSKYLSFHPSGKYEGSLELGAFIYGTDDKGERYIFHRDEPQYLIWLKQESSSLRPIVQECYTNIPVDALLSHESMPKARDFLRNLIKERLVLGLHIDAPSAKKDSHISWAFVKEKHL